MDSESLVNRKISALIKENVEQVQRRRRKPSKALSNSWEVHAAYRGKGLVRGHLMTERSLTPPFGSYLCSESEKRRAPIR